MANSVATRAYLGQYDEGVADIDKDAAPLSCARKRKRDESPDELLAGMLTRVSGMSMKMAKEVVDALHPRLSFHGADHKAIADVKVGEQRRLGPAMARTLLRLAEQPPPRAPHVPAAAP